MAVDSAHPVPCTASLVAIRGPRRSCSSPPIASTSIASGPPKWPPLISAAAPMASATARAAARCAA